jgi:ABC-type branched-subunit amino acid transport system substrate-binding protein
MAILRPIAAPMLAGWLALGGWLVAGCGSGDPPGTDTDVKIGLLLSFSGYLAASSVNSERAVLMAVEAAQERADAFGGRALQLLSRDTRSDGRKVVGKASELLNAGAAVILGPDTVDLATALRSLLEDRTIILPSYATASDVGFKPPSWFVMGPAALRIACELVAQLQSDGRKRPLLIVNPSGYNSSLSWVLANSYGMPRHVLPSEDAPTVSEVASIDAFGADAYVLAAFPTSASPLLLTLSALGGLGDGRSWYLSPTLHTPAFIESIPKGMLVGAHGVSSGTVAGAEDFRTRFRERWQDEALDDAYPFYDAAAVSLLALARALARDAAIPGGTGLSPHILAVTRAGGRLITWNELSRGIELLRQGEEVTYIGLSGSVEFDASGQTDSAATRWWTIDDKGFADVQNRSDCR